MANNPVVRAYHGTTTIAVVCKDGVVFVTDTRVTSGYFIPHRMKKIYKIDEHVAMTTAGSVADAQNIVDAMRFYANMYRLEKKAPIPISSAARVAANIFFASRLYPFLAQVLIGGVDGSGPGVYNVDLFGSLVQEKQFVATGSGSPVAYGVLEAEYSPNITVKQAVPLAINAIIAAIRRNAGTGDGFDVAIIPQDGGYYEISDEEKKKFVKSLSPLG